MDCTTIDKEMPILLLTLNFIGVIKYWQAMVKYTKEEFVRRARLKHGDKYNYDKVVYIDSQTDVEIICPFRCSVHSQQTASAVGSVADAQLSISTVI